MLMNVTQDSLALNLEFGRVMAERPVAVQAELPDGFTRRDIMSACSRCRRSTADCSQSLQAPSRDKQCRDRHAVERGSR